MDSLDRVFKKIVVTALVRKHMIPLRQALLRNRPAKSDRWWNTRWDTNGRHHGHPGHRGSPAAHAGGGDPRCAWRCSTGRSTGTIPAFAGVDLTSLATSGQRRATSGGMSRHGTHLASVLFGRPDGSVPGLAPGRRGRIVGSFAEEEGHRSQRDRARALDPAVEAGAQVSNVSGGPKVPTSAAEDLLARDDPARPRPERADRRRGRERRLRLSARPHRGGVHRGGAPVDHFTTVSEDRS